MIRHCPTCGLDTFSVDDLYCPSGCGTSLDAPPRPETPAQRRRRLRVGWTEEDLLREEDEQHQRSMGILRLIEEIERLTADAPGTVAYKAARAATKEEKRNEVRRLRDEGLSIERTRLRTGLSRRYISELRKPDPE